MPKHKEPKAPSPAEVPAAVPDPFRSPLARLLDTPDLARLVPQFTPQTLHALIRHSGLQACGELVAAATPAQLTSLFDLDLWRPAQPGQDDRFDADRFGEWLEVLAEIGETVAARIVASLDEHLVIAGLSRYIRVFDQPAIAQPTWTDDDEPIEVAVAPGEGVDCELAGYLVRAVRADSWDAIVALLFALEADHPARFHAVMRGCRLVSNSTPEVDGLDALLMAPQQLLHDVAVRREHRQSQQGYSTPADARAFLEMARQPRRRRRDGTASINPVAAAYFRDADETASSADADAVPPPAAQPASAGGSIPEAFDAIVGLLADAGLVPQQPRALLEGPRSDRFTRIRLLMEFVRDHDADAYFARSRELAFLANTLMAGSSIQGRPFTAQEASDAAVSICNLGLEHWAVAGEKTTASRVSIGATLPDDFLVVHSLVTVFEVGWAVLHAEVSLFVADELIVTLKGLRCADAETQRDVATLRRELVKQRAAGTPWRAREALAVLAMLDMPAWAGLVGLLDECPVVAEALTATLERRKGAVSATSFEFIATTSQIGAVRVFMARLPDLLGS